MIKLLFLSYVFVFTLFADEPIVPIPLDEPIDIPKAKLGKELFFDTLLSRDNSIACVSCHDIYNGGADNRVVSIGFNGAKGNIHALTVLNARYNFKQFWNGRVNTLVEQATGPLSDPTEHNMDPRKIQERVNLSKKYKKMFKEAYGTYTITYELILDAIVAFENALTTPNAKFDKYLRGEIKLTQDEQEGYTLFKQYGCITCHNGINVGGNSFQKMGTFVEYNATATFPDRSDVTHNKEDINVFKVPTLRNIAKTAPYFHDASAQTLKEALTIMSKHNLGIELSSQESDKIILFLETLSGDMPKILDTF
ncbi:MAG TPA: cytochrome B6 [Sulfurimonas sp. UBA12504]|nr:MAG: cytochrome B6 [Sulfurimonas sp. GWF2_37_8]DAB29370.1 MAG TPA: cytochrome B6 [Sulfurimonas sp. UBA12504]